MEQMLLQNVDTASVLLFALFIMSYDATHATHRLYFRFCDCGNQTLSFIGTLRLPNECQVLIASCKCNKLTFKFVFQGYQRQLRYRHSDGSYSAFGESDGKSGSTWLTAFVVKCLGQSQKYIDIDRSDLNTSIAWFRRQQNEIGCFPKVGYTHSYYLKGGWGKGNDEEGTLTAFVLIAMLEAGLPKDVSG